MISRMQWSLSRTAKRMFVERGAARKFLVPEATFKRRVRLTVPPAEFVWDDRAEARQWLNTTHPELGGRSPLQSAH